MSPNRFDLTLWQQGEETIRLESERQRRADLPPEKRYRALHPTSAEFLHQLALASNARRLVEVGMSAGYSTLWLARAAAATGGRIHTFEHNPEIVKVAREYFALATVAGFIEVHEGDARLLLEDFEGPVDFAFVDAEKEDYIAYAKLLWPLLRPGGSLVADNIISHAEAAAPYLEYLCGVVDATTMVVGIGSGLAWSVKEP